MEIKDQIQCKSSTLLYKLLRLWVLGIILLWILGTPPFQIVEKVVKDTLFCIILAEPIRMLMCKMPLKWKEAAAIYDKVAQDKILQALTTMCNVIEKGENVCYDICQKVMDKTSDFFIGIISSYWHTCG